MRDYDIIHRVEKGETLAYISKKYGVPSSLIIHHNALSGELYEGQRLVIPCASGRVYTVMPLDTAESIAGKFGITKEQLLNENKTEIIYPYMNIIIPSE